MIRTSIDGYVAEQGLRDWTAACEAARGMWRRWGDLDGCARDRRSERQRRLERTYGR